MIRKRREKQREFGHDPLAQVSWPQPPSLGPSMTSFLDTQLNTH